MPVNVRPAAANKSDVKGPVQRVDHRSEPNGRPPIRSSSSDLTCRPESGDLYADSWWYNSITGLLSRSTMPAETSAPSPIPLSTRSLSAMLVSIRSWSGRLTVPRAFKPVRPYQPRWPRRAERLYDGQYMMYTGFYGPNGSNSLTGSLTASPVRQRRADRAIAQIVTTGNISFPAIRRTPAAACRARG